MKNNESIRQAYLTLPNAGDLPNMQDTLANMPAEQEHRFESSGEFIRRLAARITKWREQLADDEEPAIFALMSNGDAVAVERVGEDGHSSVVVEGLLNGLPCMFISHQSSFQIVCYTHKIEEEEPEPRRKIGFYVGGEELEA